jgi:hypothetical protein
MDQLFSRLGLGLDEGGRPAVAIAHSEQCDLQLSGRALDLILHLGWLEVLGPD